MAVENISYTIAAHGNKPEVQVSLDLTYDASSPNKDGSFTVTAASGTYTTISTNKKTGVVTTTAESIVSLLHRHSRGNSDNRLYLDGTKNIVDQHGVSFEVASPVKGAPHRTVRINYFYSTPNGRFQQYGVKVSGAATDITTGPVASAATTSPTTNAELVAEAACFAAGTGIRVARGEAIVDVAVEALAVGDLVVTTSGALRPVRWLGHRVTDCARHPHPAAVLPVRIAAEAFGPSRPARDLHVSPGHAVCVDVMGEALIPAVALVNGTTIRQVEVARVVYWHVELDHHDIVLAENLPAESYLEMGNRGFFAESGTVSLAATPDAPVKTHADFCRPFHDAGALVTAVRARLAARAAQLAASGSVRAA